MKYFFTILLLTFTLFSQEETSLHSFYGTISHEKEGNIFNVTSPKIEVQSFLITSTDSYIQNVINKTKPQRVYFILGYISASTKGLNRLQVTTLNYTGIKIKIKTHQNFSRVKLMINSDMSSFEYAQRRGRQAHYLTEIKLKAKAKTLFFVKTTPHLSQNPFFKFKYRGIKPKEVEVQYRDNYHHVQNLKKKVKFFSIHDGSLEHIEKPNFKQEPLNNKSLQKYVKRKSLIQGGIQLTTPKVAGNGGSIPVTVRSNIPAKFILFFYKLKNEQKYHYVCEFITTPYSITDYNFKYKMPSHGYAKVILEGKDGKFYTQENYIDVALGGGDQ